MHFRLSIAGFRWTCNGAFAGASNRKSLKLILAFAAAFALAAGACANPRRDAAISSPATREEAARVLTHELTHFGVRIRGAHASNTEVYWESDLYGEPAPPLPSQREWIGGTLTYGEIERVEDVQGDNLGWRITVKARGGPTRLWLDNRDSALRARGALIKLASN